MIEMLKHTFGYRLRAAGVGFEDRQDLLGHKSNRITTHYSNSALSNFAFEPLAKLGRTLHRWQEPIARMWRFTKNNGITEGFHRKMKLIQRQAYGFRNFDNYRLRVRVLCG